MKFNSIKKTKVMKIPYFSLTFSLFFLLSLSSSILLSQDSYCGMPPSKAVGSFKSGTCDVNVSDLTTKTIRVTFHVFQKNDGSGNIPNTSQGIAWLNSLNNFASDKLGQLQPMNLSSPSPYISDSKIRLKLMNIYFWKNTTLFNKGNSTNSNGEDLYDYVMNQSIGYKNSSIHIMIPGNYSSGSNGLGSAGIACDYGCDEWTLIEDTYNNYVNGQQYWEPAKTLMHEIGHNLNLYHSWPNEDYCDDTPPNSNCWIGSSCSNNVMDYNHITRALTLDQVSRCHVWLNNNSHILYSGTEYGNLSLTLSNSGNNGSASGSTINVGSSSATVNISAPGTSSFTWTLQSGSSGSFSTANNGKTVFLSGLGSINLKVTWLENCMTFSRSLTFYNGGSYYYVGPNPTRGIISIKGNLKKKILIPLPNSKAAGRTAKITKVEVYDMNSRLIQTTKTLNSDNVELDLSREINGTYNIIIYNEEGTVPILNVKVQKI